MSGVDEIVRAGNELAAMVEEHKGGGAATDVLFERYGLDGATVSRKGLLVALDVVREHKGDELLLAIAAVLASGLIWGLRIAETRGGDGA